MAAIFRRSIFVILVISWSQLSEANPQVSYAGKVFIGLSGDVVSLPVDRRYASTYGLKLTRVGGRFFGRAGWSGTGRRVGQYRWEGLDQRSDSIESIMGRGSGGASVRP